MFLALKVFVLSSTLHSYITGTHYIVNLAEIEPNVEQMRSLNFTLSQMLFHNQLV